MDIYFTFTADEAGKAAELMRFFDRLEGRGGDDEGAAPPPLQIVGREPKSAGQS